MKWELTKLKFKAPSMRVWQDSAKCVHDHIVRHRDISRKHSQIHVLLTWWGHWTPELTVAVVAWTRTVRNQVSQYSSMDCGRSTWRPTPGWRYIDIWWLLRGWESPFSLWLLALGRLPCSSEQTHTHGIQAALTFLRGFKTKGYT